MKLGAKRVEMVQLMHTLCHEVASDFFTIDTPDPPHWNLNSCIAAICSIWVHFGLFRYCMKLGAKQAELEQLMQKIVPRSRIGIFGSEQTRSTHWTANSCFSVFCSVWVHLGSFHYCVKLCAKQAELVHIMQ